MSYILEALKKSDRERQQETPSHLQHLCETTPSFKTAVASQKRRWPWFLLAGLLIFGGLANWSGWSLWRNRNQATEGEALTQSTPARTEIAARQEPADQDIPVPMPTAPEDKSSSRPITVQAEWFDDWLSDLPKKDTSFSAEESLSAGEKEPKVIPPLVSETATNLASPVKIRRDREKIVMALPEETTVIRQPPPVTPVIGQPPPVTPVIGKPQPIPSSTRLSEPVPAAISQSHPAASEKPRNNIPYLQNLSPQLQAEIPKLQFAGHAYALEPSQRLIVINGTIMREGDQIDAATRLSEITWEGVIIDRKGVRFQVKCY